MSEWKLGGALALELLRDRKERRKSKQSSASPRSPRSTSAVSERSQSKTRAVEQQRPDEPFVEPHSPLWMSSTVGPMNPKSSKKKYAVAYNCVDLPVRREKPLITLLSHWDIVDNMTVDDNTPALNRKGPKSGFLQQTTQEQRLSYSAALQEIALTRTPCRSEGEQTPRIQY